MPRNGSNIYSYPVGSEGVSDTPIESSKYNALIADIEDDLNYPRPIVAGGTGAASADAALTALGGEKAKQVVTNYATHTFLPGSFYSAAGATGAPSANICYGIVYERDSTSITLQAVDAVTGVVYVRRKTANVWGNWIADPTRTATGGIVVNSNDVAANAVAPSGAIQTPGGVHARGNVVGLSTQHDNPGAVWGYSAVLGHCNANAYAVSGHRASFRSSVGGQATFHHTGVATDNIVGVYGWTPTGGHGNSAIPGVFDRPDGASSFPFVAARAVSVSFLGGLNNSGVAYPIGVYDWGLPGYAMFVRGDGYIHTNGDINTNGALQVMSQKAVDRTGAFTAIYGGDGAARSIYVGSGATKINYHDMDRHIFRTSGAAATLFDMTATLNTFVQPIYASGGLRDGSGNIFSNVPVNATAAPYSTVADDYGKLITTNSGVITITGTLYPVGTVITVAAFGGANQIANTQTMYLAGTAATGTRNLANTGIATATKINSTAWLISGAGLT